MQMSTNPLRIATSRTGFKRTPVSAPRAVESVMERTRRLAIAARKKRERKTLLETMVREGEGDDLNPDSDPADRPEEETAVGNQTDVAEAFNPADFPDYDPNDLPPGMCFDSEGNMIPIVTDDEPGKGNSTRRRTAPGTAGRRGPSSGMTLDARASGDDNSTYVMTDEDEVAVLETAAAKSRLAYEAAQRKAAEAKERAERRRAAKSLARQRTASERRLYSAGQVIPEALEAATPPMPMARAPKPWDEIDLPNKLRMDIVNSTQRSSFIHSMIRKCSDKDRL